MARFISILFIFFYLLSWEMQAQVSFSGSPRTGCDTLVVSFTYTGTTIPTTILWHFGNGDTSHRVAPLPVIYDKPGMYNVSVSVNGGPEVTEPAYIQFRPVPASDFTYHDTLQPADLDFVFLPVKQPVDTAIYSYRWYFADDSSVLNTMSVEHQFASEGLYPVLLTVTDDFLCTDSTMRLVNVAKKIMVPNVFTPNGDGINDLITLPVNGITTYSFKIFSRYGILIYRDDSRNPVWDGTNTSGVKMQPGVYYYSLQSLDPEHPLSQAGFIHLFR